MGVMTICYVCYVWHGNMLSLTFNVVQMLHVVTSFVRANSTSFGMIAYGFEISDLSKAFDSIDMINRTTLSLSKFK